MSITALILLEQCYTLPEMLVVSHDYYTLSYNETHEQANWVAYTLREEQVVNNDFDRPYFEQDPKVKSKSAHWRNYKNSGYDRGHLVAAADMEFSYDAFKDTFFTSNISPQLHDFNSGVWNYLEQRVRRWAKENDDVFVITGGVLKNPIDAIGSEQVSVPAAFYKIVVDNLSRGVSRYCFFDSPSRGH
ncbi:DNA/RNA non-specific endonuclease [Gilvibacter sp.]|uniref:DNA/RNA non-specific endonuclease n=1 Tax=Gilvibacter sp. TaxID=2729997 RepID=UPI003F4A35DF